MEGLMTKTRQFIKNNGSYILAFLGSAGVVGTAVVSAKSAVKAVVIIEADSRENHDGDPYAYTPKEAVKSAWKCYIPSFVIGASTIGCIVGSAICGKKSQAALSSACALLSTSYQEYRDKLKELYGEEAHNKIVDAIAKDHCEDVYISYSNLCGVSSTDFNTSEIDVVRTFYDSYSERYFESTINKVLQAEYHLNRNYVLGGEITLNEFYDFLGLAPIDGGDCLWWSYVEGLAWIDFNNRVTTLDDGMEVCVIDFDWLPSEYTNEDLGLSVAGL